MRLSNGSRGSRRSTPEPDHSQRVRFSSVHPSTPLFTFSVLEWTPASNLHAHLYPKRASSLQRLENSASMTTTEEERRDPRDRVVFEATSGTWTSFRQLSCCGDVLVLEDAESIDVGPPRRHEYTWQQGPGRLPSVESSNTSFGASGGWKQTLSSTIQSAAEVEAEAAKRGTLIARPSHHHREVPLQDIHSIRRHCFKRPVPLTFNSGGHLSDSTQQQDARGSRSKASQHGSATDDLKSLEWRYELWGPVGVIFMLRGGTHLFLAFASSRHAEQMEELLLDFASGKGLQRRQQQQQQQQQLMSTSSTSIAPAAAPPTPTSASLPAMANSSNKQGRANLLESMASAAGYSVGSPVSPGLPGSPARSNASLRLGSCEASVQGAPSSQSVLPMSALAAQEFPTRRTSSVAATLASGTTVVSVASPTLPLAAQSSTAVSGLAGNTSLAAFPSTPSTPATSSRTNGPSFSKLPGTGYLYCRPWGEAERHRRYYLRPASATPSSSLVRLSRHRLPAWQKLRQTLGQEPRCVSIDAKQTYLTPSSTHENVFRVESVVDTYAQYRDVVPLGGAVATAGPGNESASMMAARRREMELCRARPVVFEALAKTREERAEWLAWLQARGAAVLRSEVTVAPHMVAAARENRSPSKPSKAPFQPLGHELLLLPTSPVVRSTPRKAASVDRWVSNCAVPSSAADLSPTADPLGGARQPHLPLREGDSERGSVAASLRPRWAEHSPRRHPQPHPHPMRPVPLSPVNTSKQSTVSSSAGSPDRVSVGDALRNMESGSGSEARHRRSADVDEAPIVVEDDERDARLLAEKLLRQCQQLQQNQKEVGLAGGSAVTSPKTPQGSELAVLDHTARPSRLRVAPLAKQSNAVLSSSSVTHEGKPATTMAGTSSSSGALSAVPAAALLSTLAEEGTTTGHTLSGTGPTVVGASRTPPYLGDTSSGDLTPRYPTPSPTSTAAATSPHFKTPPLRSSSGMATRETDEGGGVDGGRTRWVVTASCRSTPRSPHSILTEQNDQPLFEGAGATAREGEAPAMNDQVMMHKVPTGRVATEGEEDGTPLPRRIVSSATGHAELRRASTDPQLLLGRLDTAVYSSEARGAAVATQPPSVAVSQASPASASSSAMSVCDVRGATAKTLHARSETAVRSPEGSQAHRGRGSTSPTPLKNSIAAHERRAAAAPSPSPSPDAPSDAVPLDALRADACAQSRSEVTPVTKRLFPPSEQEDEAVQTRDGGSRKGYIAMPTFGAPQPTHSLSANGSLSVPKAEAVPDDASGAWSGFPTSSETLCSNSFLPTSPVHWPDPRLLQFFTSSPHLHHHHHHQPHQRGEIDTERNGSGGEAPSGSPLGAYAVPNHSSSKHVSKGGSHSIDASLHNLALRGSVLNSPLPPRLPPRAGSLTWTSSKDALVDSGSRVSAQLTLPVGCGGSEGVGPPVLRSAPSRITYRDSEQLRSPLGLQSRAVMEERKRVFRNSLFVKLE